MTPASDMSEQTPTLHPVADKSLPTETSVQESILPVSSTNVFIHMHHGEGRNGLSPQSSASSCTISKSNTARRPTQHIYICTCVVLAFINYLLIQFDKYVLSYFQPEIFHDLSLTPTRYAILTGYSSGVTNALLALPLAFLCDLTSARVWILSVASGWAGLCVVFQGLARNYTEIYCARLGMSIGQTAVEAISVSLISDLVGWRNCFIASSVFYMGVFIGEAISGQIATAFHHNGTSWRIALRAMGIAAVVVAVMMRLIMREPKRQRNLLQQYNIPISTQSEQLSKSNRARSWNLFKSTVLYLIRMRSFGLLVVSTSLRFLGAVVYGYYMPGYVVSLYQSETNILSRYGIIVGVTGCFTVVSGGLLTSRLWHRTKWTPVWLTIIGGVLSSIFIVLMLFSAQLAKGDVAYGLSIFYGNMVASYITGEAWLGCMTVFIAMFLPPETKTFGLAIWSSIQILIYSSGPEIVGLALRNFSPGTEAYTKVMRTTLAAVIPTAYCFGSLGLILSIPFIEKDLRGSVVQGQVPRKRVIIVIISISLLVSAVIILLTLSFK